MDWLVASPTFAISLFLGMLLLLEMGWRMAPRERAVRFERDPVGVAAVEGSVFALFGLLLAFTFSGSVERFNKHRELIAEETNAIGTAYLRLDLLPKRAQPTLRELFGKYLDARLDLYRKLPDIEAAKAALATSTELQHQIWTQAVNASRLADSHPDGGKLLLPATSRSWLHILGFTAITVITVVVILDIEYRRKGLFRADAYDQVLIDLRENMR